MPPLPASERAPAPVPHEARRALKSIYIRTQDFERWGYMASCSNARSYARVARGKGWLTQPLVGFGLNWQWQRQTIRDGMRPWTASRTGLRTVSPPEALHKQQLQTRRKRGVASHTNLDERQTFQCEFSQKKNPRPTQVSIAYLSIFQMPPEWTFTILMSLTVGRLGQKMTTWPVC